MSKLDKLNWIVERATDITKKLEKELADLPEDSSKVELLKVELEEVVQAKIQAEIELMYLFLRENGEDDE